MSVAKRTGFEENKTDYNCIFDWPTTCYLQCGSSGVVFKKDGGYKTAFFEAFPKEPEIFIRGEGENIEEAEKDAWNKYQKIINCKDHDFERKYFKDGTGVCKHCNYLKERVFEPLERCKICNKPTYWSSDKHKNYYCDEHSHLIQEEDKYEWEKDIEEGNILEALNKMMNS